ncbi:MAG: hypothetical protein FVQ79_02270 [Planctomycetes bacterium]|nr:hypothetical protein [Planctomycetota bacterium]
MDIEKMDEMKVKAQIKIKKMTAKFRENYHKPRKLREFNRAMRTEKMKGERARILEDQQPGPEQNAPAVPGNELGV